MSKKHESSHEGAEHEQVSHKVVQENIEDFAPNEAEFEGGEVNESGVVTLTIGDIVFNAPDKYEIGHVMTADEAVHYSNFIRSRCQSNMISMEKRNKKTWDVASAEEYYTSYVLGAPRGRGPSEETIQDEAMDMLLDELATRSGNPLPAGKGSKAKIAELKEAISKLPKYQPRIAELVEDVKAEYAAKAKVKGDTGEKPPVFSVDNLF